jgi:hypothetical protein
MHIKTVAGACHNWLFQYRLF